MMMSVFSLITARKNIHTGTRIRYILNLRCQLVFYLCFISPGPHFYNCTENGPVIYSFSPRFIGNINKAFFK